MKKLLLLLCIFLPSRVKRLLYIKCFNWQIHPSAKIGFSLLMLDHLIMEEDAVIGSLTVVKGLKTLHIGKFSILGKLNWVTGFPLGHSSDHFKSDSEREPSLYIGEHSAITSRHIIDCTSKVTIGSFTTFAGFRSQILTHSINLKENKQSSQPIKIGDYCFIGTSCILLPGSVVPEYSLVSAGSVVTGDLKTPQFLYGGVPAKAIKELNLSEYKYLSRDCGFVI